MFNSNSSVIQFQILKGEYKFPKGNYCLLKVRNLSTNEIGILMCVHEVDFMTHLELVKNKKVKWVLSCYIPTQFSHKHPLGAIATRYKTRMALSNKIMTVGLAGENLHSVEIPVSIRCAKESKEKVFILNLLKILKGRSLKDILRFACIALKNVGKSIAEVGYTICKHLNLSWTKFKAQMLTP